jgi:hypothetical protein
MPFNGLAALPFPFAGARPAICSVAAGRRQKNAPAVHTFRGILVEHLVGADVHETPAAPGLDVFVAIAADVEGRTAVEATEAATPMPAMMTTVAAVHAMAAVATVATTLVFSM